MSLATLFSRILGLVREQVFAYFFGASHATDAFQIAFRIPNLLRDLFAEGAMSASLIPTFTRVRAEEGDRLAEPERVEVPSRGGGRRSASRHAFSSPS